MRSKRISQGGGLAFCLSFVSRQKASPDPNGKGANAEKTLARRFVHDNISKSQIARNASSFKIHAYVESALYLDVNTAMDSAVFWSGKGNRVLAENYAFRTGKTTLEMTPGGNHLDSLKIFEKHAYAQAIRPWEVLSKRFAQNASGRVSAFVENASQFSIYSRIESPALRANQNITEVLLSQELEQGQYFSKF